MGSTEKLHDDHLIRYSFESLTQRHSLRFRPMELNPRGTQQCETGAGPIVKALPPAGQPGHSQHDDACKSSEKRAYVKPSRRLRNLAFASITVVAGISGYIAFGDRVTDSAPVKLEKQEMPEQRPVAIYQSPPETDAPPISPPEESDKAAQSALMLVPDQNADSDMNDMTDVTETGQTTQQSNCNGPRNALHLCGTPG